MIIRRRPRLSRVSIALVMFLWSGCAAAQNSFEVGYHLYSVPDALLGDTILAALWYPSSSPESENQEGGYALRVAVDGLPVAGQFPLVILSHGTGGSHLGHRDLAVALVRAGYMVLTPRHPDDNSEDQSAFGSDRQLLGRPRHIELALEALLGDSRWGGQIETTRIGMVGFSMGGYTTVALLGGRPEFDRLEVYCRDESDDPVLCAAGFNGRVRQTLDTAFTVSAPRIRAAVIMAPAFGFLFDPASLEDIRVPVLVYAAANDEILRAPYHVEPLTAALPKVVDLRRVAGAGHYVFLAPCPEDLGASLPAICQDPEGVDRGEVHRRINEEIIEFFDARLW